jgi:hypothetical protein
MQRLRAKPLGVVLIAAFQASLHFRQLSSVHPEIVGYGWTLSIYLATYYNNGDTDGQCGACDFLAAKEYLPIYTASIILHPLIGGRMVALWLIPA